MKHVPDHSAQPPRPHHWMNADGTCHAGDLFEHGSEPVALYTAHELVRIVNAEKAAAWDEGYVAHRDDFARSLLGDVERTKNHYRAHIEEAAQ